MTSPTMQYAAEHALREALEAPGELTWRTLEDALRRNGLALVTQQQAVSLSDVEKAESEAAVHGADALFNAASENARPMREGIGKPEKAITIDELGSLADELFDGD